MTTPTVDPALPYAIYARTSSDDKDTENSGKIDEHITQAEECAKRYGLTNCFGVYSEADISGGIWPDVPEAALDNASETKYKGKRRPQFTTIVRLIEAKAIKYLVVSETTRICRPNNLKQLIYLMELFKENNIIILSNKQGPIDYKDFFQTLVELLKGSLGREEINKNHYLAIEKRKKLADGGYISSAVDFGYKTNLGKIDIVLPDGKHHDTSIIEINDSEASTIRTIYEKYNNGESLYNIRKWLGQHECKTKTGKTLWRTATLTKILSNPHYCGKFKIDGQLKDSPVFKPIIEPALWLQVQGKLSHGKKYAKKSYGVKSETKYPLAGGLLRCASCGESMQGQTELIGLKTKSRYRCANPACNKKAYVKTDEINNLAELIIKNESFYDTVKIGKDKNETATLEIKGHGKVSHVKSIIEDKNEKLYGEIERLNGEVEKLNNAIHEYTSMEFESERDRVNLINARQKEIKERTQRIEILQTQIFGRFPVDGTLQQKARYLIKRILCAKNECVKFELRHGATWQVAAKHNTKKRGMNYIPDKNELWQLESGMFAE